MTLVDDRVERLSASSLRRVIEPDTDVTGELGPGMILPQELLSLWGVGIELSRAQWEKLAREELAAILDAGIRFESMLMAGFGFLLAYHRDLTDPRVTYILHEIGEETRHSRLFARVIAQLEPEARNPFMRSILGRIDRAISPRAIQRKALFCVMVLAGEEGPDLIQKRAADHPQTDPFVKNVSRYHRLEEARHLSFARMLLPELWKEASRLERLVIRVGGPAVVTGVFDTLVHPDVYRSIGLPGWRTWNRVRRSEPRRQLRAQALRPVAEALRAAGAFGRRKRLPRRWRRICLLDAVGSPRA